MNSIYIIFIYKPLILSLINVLSLCTSLSVSLCVCSLEEECDVPLCTASLSAKNRELQSDMKRVTAVFEKLQNYISLLAVPSEFGTLY